MKVKKNRLPNSKEGCHGFSHNRSTWAGGKFFAHAKSKEPSASLETAATMETWERIATSKLIFHMPWRGAGGGEKPQSKSKPSDGQQRAYESGELWRAHSRDHQNGPPGSWKVQSPLYLFWNGPSGPHYVPPNRATSKLYTYIHRQKGPQSASEPAWAISQFSTEWEDTWTDFMQVR